MKYQFKSKEDFKNHLAETANELELRKSIDSLAEDFELKQVDYGTYVEIIHFEDGTSYKLGQAGSRNNFTQPFEYETWIIQSLADYEMPKIEVTESDFEKALAWATKKGFETVSNFEEFAEKAQIKGSIWKAVVA